MCGAGQLFWTSSHQPTCICPYTHHLLSMFSIKLYGGMIIVFIWRHHFMTSRLLLFYSLFSEVNFNWQRKRTLWKKVFFLKGNSANPCLVHCLTSMECGWSCVMNNFFKILYSYLCHGQFLRIYFFCKQKIVA